MIGRQITAVREALELTRAGLARRVGVSPSYLSRIEAGLRTPSLDVIQRIQTEAHAAGVEFHLVETLMNADDVVLALNDLLNDPKVSGARKASVRRLVLVLVRSV